ncbi:hypothetical protein FNH05_02060 [Amycolatopsis rhizosphaerae]|uniref:Class I SAM-dependent methyltransferase n=1 Tax=Amycolatopsis rhizosphaerae TaxID=2053003 RepID=A0A558DLA9_9PSEU|nr:hypothetical protein [Amycolatopsis rhizosphaerae]TVT61809.1 hypothetical protein FNH05_02060 [Amycolatopsis rhizosphaerae]
MPIRITGTTADAIGTSVAPPAADPAGAVAFLAELADRVTHRPGTGRVFVPGGGPVAGALAGEGYRVTDGTEGTEGPLGSGLRFDVVFSGSDELSRLLSQRDQLRLVRRLAAFLRPGAALVIQGRHPDPAAWARDALVADHDHTRQTLLMAGARFPQRYVWPAELDLMAELAGLAPEGCWGGWYGEPLVCGGPVVSVFRS